jgi:hypothetical protein
MQVICISPALPLIKRLQQLWRQKNIRIILINMRMMEAILFEEAK